MPAPVTGGRRRGASVKTLKRALKKAGLKTTGKKAALTRRAKKAGLRMKGGVWPFNGSTKYRCELNTYMGKSVNCRDSCEPGEVNAGTC